MTFDEFKYVCGQLLMMGGFMVALVLVGAGTLYAIGFILSFFST